MGAEKYGTTNDATSQEDNEETAFLQSAHIEQAKQKRTLLYLTYFNIFFITTSILTLVCAVYSQTSTSSHSAAKLMHEFNIFSPAMHIVEYHHTQFQLPNPLNSSKYVGTTDDVENAWMDIAYLPDQMVSRADFPMLQKPADSLQVTDPQTGETGYRVGLEVFHQLHCLNLLRMATYPDYYSKLWWSDTNDEPEKVRAHLDHCIEILRMNLMCLADVNVFTFHEVPGRVGPWPDYESHHVCRDFEKIKRWANENAMPEADV